MLLQSLAALLFEREVIEGADLRRYLDGDLEIPRAPAITGTARGDLEPPAAKAG